MKWNEEGCALRLVVRLYDLSCVSLITPTKAYGEQNAMTLRRSHANLLTG
jgi:hypothetical protein